jgi:hypothetical protein
VSSRDWWISRTISPIMTQAYGWGCVRDGCAPSRGRRHFATTRARAHSHPSLERTARDSTRASRTSRTTVGRAPRGWVSGFGICGF